MREKNGILIIPSNQNGATLLNVLSIIFDEASKEKYKFPNITKITFLETDSEEDSANTIKLQGEDYSQLDAYKKLCNILGLRGIELRVRELTDYVKDIPQILMDAVNETGDQNLVVLDLTNGTKEITGSLYTAGTLCGIKQMIYVQVKRNSAGKFYELSEENDKLNLFDLTTFKALDDIQTLASMNGMEFVMYKKKIEALRGIRNTTLWDDICTRLDNAVNYYFGVNDNDASTAIREIGIVNERIIKIVLEHFTPIWKKYYTDSSRKKGLKLDELRECEVWYNTNVQKVRDKSLNDEEKNQWQDYGKLFECAPNLYEFINAERVYRNRVSHGLKQTLDRKDAKIAIEIMLKIIDGLEHSPLKEELYADEV